MYEWHNLNCAKGICIETDFSRIYVKCQSILILVKIGQIHGCFHENLHVFLSASRALPLRTSLNNFGTGVFDINKTYYISYAYFPSVFWRFLDNYTKFLETVCCLYCTHIYSIYVTQPVVLEYYKLINVYSYIHQTQLTFWYKTNSYIFRLSASCVKIHKGQKLFNYCICCCKLTKKLQQLIPKYLIIAYAHVTCHFMKIYNSKCTIN